MKKSKTPSGVRTSSSKKKTSRSPPKTQKAFMDKGFGKLKPFSRERSVHSIPSLVKGPTPLAPRFSAIGIADDRAFTNSLTPSIPRAPGGFHDSIAAGYNLWTGPKVEFLGMSSGHLRLHVNIPLTGIYNDNSVVQGQDSGFALQCATANTYTATPVATLAMSPFAMAAIATFDATHDAVYKAQPDCLGLLFLAGCFGKYRLASNLRLHYMPAVSTSVLASYALCWTTDVFHPVIGSRSYYTGGTPPNTPLNYTTCKSSLNSIQFAAWAPWSCEFDTDQRTEYYMTSNNAYSTTIANATTNCMTDESRLAYFGALSCCVSPQGASAGFMGELYMEATFDLMDYSPQIAATALPSYLRGIGEVGLSSRVCNIRREESKEEVKETSELRDISIPKLTRYVRVEDDEDSICGAPVLVSKSSMSRSMVPPSKAAPIASKVPSST